MYIETVTCESHWNRPGLMVDYSGCTVPDAILCALRVNVSYVSQKTHLSIETRLDKIIISRLKKMMGWLREQNFSMSIFKAKAADSLHKINKQTKNKLMLIIYVSKPKSPYHLLGLVQYSAQSSTHLTVKTSLQ